MTRIEKYDLTKEEFETSLKMAEIVLLMRSKPVERPKSIFVISQAGGGKTGLKSFVELENKNKQSGDLFVEVNPDEVAIYHKYYEKILEEFPKESYAMLQKFVKPALDDYLRQRIVQLRNSVIQEGTFGNTDGYLEILEFQKNGGQANIGKVQANGQREAINVKGGYDIQINVLAVDRFESLLSSYEREQYFIDSNLPPRVVTAENHDRAYYNLLETLREVENKKLYDEIRVFKRGELETEPELVHITGDGKYPSAVECVKQTRYNERKKLLENPEAYKKRIEILKEKAKSEIQLEKLNKLEEEFDKCLEEVKDAQVLTTD